MRFFAVLTALTIAAFTTAAPLDNYVDTSPASPLLAPRGCKSLSCILITYADRTQSYFNNVHCIDQHKEVIGVLVGECYCAMWELPNCKGNFQVFDPCPGVIGPDGFKFPVKSISCGSWEDPAPPS
ncbi:hypothetical protein DPSP01_011990 [Paraphaeosphaeria sporulosa]